MKNYFSRIARAAAVGIVATGLVFLPAKNAAVQSYSQSKSVLEQMIERHYNPPRWNYCKPQSGNLWELKEKCDEVQPKKRAMLKIANSKNKFSKKQVLREFNKQLGLRYGYALSEKDMARNLEIISELHDAEFDYLVGRVGFDNVRSLTMRDEECGKYPVGEERAEKLRGLVGKINYHAKGRNVNAWKSFGIISVESGGENFLNCEGGGGVFHLLYIYNKINPLNEDKNIYRGIEMLEFLTNQFGNPQTAAIAFNTSNGRLIKAKKEFEGYMKRSPNHLELMSYLKKTQPNAHKKAARYEKLLEGHEKFLKKYFLYDERKNQIMTIPQIKYFSGI